MMDNPIITFTCPYCHEKITLKLDNDNNVIDVNHYENVILSENEMLEILNKQGIEFG